jgi:hypothetical protein
MPTVSLLFRGGKEITFQFRCKGKDAIKVSFAVETPTQGGKSLVYLEDVD